MKLIRGLHNLRVADRGSVVTIGNFDGVHTGHRTLLRRLRQLADRQDQPLTVVLFEPQPREYFGAAQAPARLTSLAAKVRLLAQCGVEQVLCLTFNRRLRELSAEQFVKRVLVTGLGASQVVVGDDFRFGCDRQGNFALLEHLGETLDFKVEHAATFQWDDERVSSSRVRTLLASGNFRQAACLLGRPFHYAGCVRRDRQLGRTLGVPTANLPLPLKPPALQGVYVVMVRLPSGTTHWGVANIGWRPTVGSQRPVLEVHLFDFNGDLYGQRLTVIPCQRLRGERRFDGLDALRDQLQHDIAAGRDYADNRADDGSISAAWDALYDSGQATTQGSELLATVPAASEPVR